MDTGEILINAAGFLKLVLARVLFTLLMSLIVNGSGQKSKVSRILKAISCTLQIGIMITIFRERKSL